MLRHSEVAARLDPRSPGFDADPFFVVPCPPDLHFKSTARTLRATRRQWALSRRIAKWLRSILPRNRVGEFATSQLNIEPGAASIDLRLGTWFLVTRQTKVPVLEITRPTALEQRLARYVRENEVEEEEANSLRAALMPKITDSQLAHSVHVRFGQDFILHPRSFVLGVTLEWLRIPSNLGGYVTGKSSWGRRGLVIATATGVHPGFTGCLTLELANLGDIPIAIRPGMAIAQIFLHDVHSAEATIAVDHSSFACKRRPRQGHPEPDRIAKQLSDNDS